MKKIVRSILAGALAASLTVPAAATAVFAEPPAVQTEIQEQTPEEIIAKIAESSSSLIEDPASDPEVIFGDTETADAAEAAAEEVASAEEAPAPAEEAVSAEEAAEDPAAEETVSAEEAPAPAEEAVSAEDTAEDPAAEEDEGSLFFIGGSVTEDPVTGMDDAKKILLSMLDEFGVDESTQFEPWREVTDTSGNHYYIFRQMYMDTTVSGGAVKVVTDADDNMIGLVCSVESELPDVEESEGITAAEAEAQVLRHEEEAGRQNPVLIGEATSKIILPVELELNPEFEAEKEESRYVWVVYSENPDDSFARGSDLPYLAHYVSMTGEYLYSMPTILPGDEASSAGFDASYIFEFMEPADYTGTVTLSDGTEKEISVTLMRDSRTGMYYLGDIRRRIVVADCYEFLYNKGKVVLEASPDNTGWDSTALLSLYNYGRAWDYYNEIGWKGGDGLETPIIILKDYCDKNHIPIDNAAYAGKYYGWQVFLSSSANDFAQALDVLAHEFTHCVTGTVMTYNAYKNDYGAINEAMSDIQGNLCEMMAGATTDTEWLLGEMSSTTVRSMSDPHRYGQPEYTWDLYYQDDVETPTDINDRGGVHSNSSLLNNIAYRLCTDGGMTMEEARSFWFAVDCSMVPGTDYPQLSILLPWVLENLGLEKYESALEDAIRAVRLDGSGDVPELPENQTMVTLTLPDTELFRDGNWALMIMTVDVKGIADRISSILTVTGEPYDEAFNALADIIKGGVENLPVVGDLLPDTESTPETTDAGKDMLSELAGWIQEQCRDLIYHGTASAGEDGRTIRMVTRPGLTLPLLFRLEFAPSDMTPKSAGALVYMFGRWVDLGEVMKAGQGTAEEIPLTDLPDLVPILSGEFEDYPENGLPIEKLLFFITHRDAVADKLFFHLNKGEVCELPSEGLENVVLLDTSFINEIMEIVGYQGAVTEETEAADAQSADAESTEIISAAENPETTDTAA